VPQAVPEKLPPMPPLPTPTGLSITVDADEAIIVVDGRIVGDSLKRLNLVLDEPGRHEVEITAPGRLPFRKTVTVDAGTTLPIRAELAPEGGRDSSFTRRPKRIESSRPVRRSAPAEEGPGARVTRDRPTRRSPPSSDEEDDDGTINPYPVRKR
jgi:hypothetical protein